MVKSLSDNVLSIYVSSTDRYDWLHEGFFFYFHKYWSDCPYEIYLGSETKEFHDNRVNSLTIGEETQWGDLTIKNLEKIQSPYILLMLDDFFLERNVDSDVIKAIITKTQELGAKHVRLSENGLPKKLSLNEVENGFINICQSKYYRCSLQTAIWEREYLLSILRSEENPWEFELRGSERISCSDGIYFLKKQPLIFHFGGVAHKGYLERKFAKRMQKDGLLFNNRYVMTRRRQILKFLEDLHNDLHLSNKIPQKIKNFVKRKMGESKFGQ